MIHLIRCSSGPFVSSLFMRYLYMGQRVEGLSENCCNFIASPSQLASRVQLTSKHVW